MESTVCMTCGKVLGHLYEEYDKMTVVSNTDDSYFLKDTDNREIFDKLGVKKWCCRMYFVGRYSITNALYPINISNISTK